MSIPRPLTAPAFRSIWLSGLVSDTGDWLLLIALPLVVLRLTGSAFGTSLAFLLEFVPAMAFTPLAGWCAEHLDARRFLVVVALAQALGLLPLLAVGHLASARATTAVLFAVIVVQAALAAVSDPTRNALLPRLIEREDLVAANSLTGLAQNAARLIGGPAGGLLLATGLSTVVIVDLASFAFAALLIARVRPAQSAAPAPGRQPRGSNRTVLARPGARSVLAVTFGAQIAQGMFVVLFVLFVVRQLHGNATDVGLLRGVQAVGAIAGAVGLTLLARRAAPARLVAASTLVFGGVCVVLWNAPLLTTALPPYVVLFVLVGAPGVVLGTGLASQLQADVPAALHGRAFSLAGLSSNLGQAIGIFGAGALTATLGLPVLLNVQAGVYLLVGLAATYALHIA